MKIVQINSVYDFGSTGRIVKDIHFELISNGHESHVFYGRGARSNDSNVVKISNKISNLIDLLLTRFFSLHGESNYFNTKRMIKKLKIINPDMVQLHNLHGYYVNYPMLLRFCSEKKIPVIWLLHDQWVISGNSAYFDENIDWNNLSKERKLELSGKYPKSFFKNYNNSIHNYKKKKRYIKLCNPDFITPSNWLKNSMKNTFISDYSINVIHNGIDTSIFTYKEYKNSEKIEILGVANIWDKRKGIEYFNRLSEDLDSRFRITVVGKIHEESESLNDKINHIERTDSLEKLVELYSQSDLFINASLIDNFPTTILEAQACGTPVVTFETGGAGESLTKDTGRIIKKGDYEKLLFLVSNSRKKTNKQITDCMNNAKNYDKRLMVYKYLEMYKQKVDGLIYNSEEGKRLKTSY